MGVLRPLMQQLRQTYMDMIRRCMRRGAGLCAVLFAVLWASVGLLFVAGTAQADELDLLLLQDRSEISVLSGSLNLGDEEEPLFLSTELTMTDDLGPLLGLNSSPHGVGHNPLLGDLSGADRYGLQGSVGLDLGVAQPFIKLNVGSGLDRLGADTGQLSFGGGVNLGSGALVGSLEGERSQNTRDDEIYSFFGRVKFQF